MDSVPLLVSRWVYDQKLRRILALSNHQSSEYSLGQHPQGIHKLTTVLPLDYSHTLYSTTRTLPLFESTSPFQYGGRKEQETFKRKEGNQEEGCRPFHKEG